MVVNEDNGTVTICLKTNTTAAREIAIEIVTSEETGVPNAATGWLAMFVFRVSATVYVDDMLSHSVENV